MKRASLVLLLACSDYGVGPVTSASPPGPDADSLVERSPEVLVSPAEILLGEWCRPDGVPLRVANVGDGALTWSRVRISGEGWSLRGDPTPRVLEPGTSSTIQVMPGRGPGALEIHTDDPERPVVAVPLDARANVGPDVTLVAPADGALLGELEDVDVVAHVLDPDDAPELLSVSLVSDQDGLLADVPVAADGMATFTWPAHGRTPGPHVLTAWATDPCGVVDTYEIGVCSDGFVTRPDLDLGEWTLSGTARWYPDDRELVLTEDANFVVGGAFLTDAPVAAGAVELEFDFFIGDGTGADGISVTVLDKARAISFLGGTGCGIGYGGNAPCTDGPALPGWSLELDTFYNPEIDFTDLDHLAFSVNGNLSAPQVETIVPELEDTGWHRMRIEMHRPRLTVLLDGVAVIDEDVAGMHDFTGFVGFTAGTGGDTNRHVIRSLEVTSRFCDE